MRVLFLIAAGGGSQMWTVVCGSRGGGGGGGGEKGRIVVHGTTRSTRGRETQQQSQATRAVNHWRRSGRRGIVCGGAFTTIRYGGGDSSRGLGAKHDRMGDRRPLRRLSDG